MAEIHPNDIGLATYDEVGDVELTTLGDSLWEDCAETPQLDDSLLLGEVATSRDIE